MAHQSLEAPSPCSRITDKITEVQSAPNERNTKPDLPLEVAHRSCTISIMEVLKSQLDMSLSNVI